MSYRTAYGTFPKILGRYVMKSKFMDLEEDISK